MYQETSTARKPPRPAALSRLAAWARPLTSRTAFMQRIQDRVRAGYTKWIGGEIASEQWPPLAVKFNALYHVSRTTKHRSRARAKGIGSAMLVAYYDARAHMVRWILQVSAGIHPAHDMEPNMRDATTREGRVVLPAMGYELVRLDGKWTWRMTELHEKSWLSRIRRAASQPDPEQATMLARQIVWSLSRVPGFRGIRRDAFALRGKLLRDWSRLRSKQDLKLLPPRPWPRIGYARRLKSQ